MSTTPARGVLIIGATSAIAHETAKLYAAEGAHLFLAARNAERLDTIAEDLKVRGAGAITMHVYDLADLTHHESLVEQAISALPSLDIALIAYGVLGDQREAERNFAQIQQLLRVNFESVISLLVPIANHLEDKGAGTIAVISSVAGDRGRQSNYIYGTAKGALNVYLQGLRNRLTPAGVQVLTIKPGFVDTPMTADFQKGALWVGPDSIARGIHRAIAKGKREVYLPFFWRGIMAIIKSIPETLFVRLKL